MLVPPTPATPLVVRLPRAVVLPTSPAKLVVPAVVMDSVCPAEAPSTVEAKAISPSDPVPVELKAVSVLITTGPLKLCVPVVLMLGPLTLVVPVVDDATRPASGVVAPTAAEKVVVPVVFTVRPNPP